MANYYTTVKKILPSMTWFLKHVKNAEEYNKVNHALYHFFNSSLLTKGDYVHLTNVLCEKFPLYQVNNDLNQYKEMAISYAKYNYPANPDIDKAINNLLSGLVGVNPKVISDCLFTLQEKLPEVSDFVGVEIISKNTSFNLNDVTDGWLDNIKKMLNVK